MMAVLFTNVMPDEAAVRLAAMSSAVRAAGTGRALIPNATPFSARFLQPPQRHVQGRH